MLINSGSQSAGRGGIVDRETVVLRCDEALVSAQTAYRLIVAAVTVLKFVGLAPAALARS